MKEKVIKFRRKPIEDISKKGYGSYYRQVRTTNEKRAFPSLQEIKNYDLRIRKSRNPNSLPDSRDDVPRCNQRSWKKQKKKKQWM